MTFVEKHVKWSVTLTDRFGPEILTVLEVKGQVLHRVRLHVKVPGWLSNLNGQIFMKSLTLRVIVASNVPVRNESKMIIVYLISYRQFNI